MAFACLFSLSCNKKTSDTLTCDDKVGLHNYADFPIGSAVDQYELRNNPAYRNIVIEQFDRISMENAWLWTNVHPAKNYFDWTDFDYLVNFAETYDKDIIGHSLVYFDYNPSWLNSYLGSREAWIELLKNHINTIVSRYKGRISAWIVVNEAFNDDGTLRKSIWLDNIGPDYIELAYRFAHEADPDAVLFYNDYGLALNPVKLKAVLRTMKTLKSQGMPLDGIGTQLHIHNEFPEVFEINRMATEIQKDGWLIYYSEIDISINIFGTKTSPSQADLDRQKFLLKEVVKGFKQLNKRQQYGISFWNVGDRDTWIRYTFNRNDWPCMYDDFYKPKPMYCGIKEALQK